MRNTLFLILTFAAGPDASAAVVLTSLETKALSANPNATVANSITAVMVDLTDRSGLTVGAPIRITLSGPAGKLPLWVGGFIFGTLGSTANFECTLELSAAGLSTSTTQMWQEAVPAGPGTAVGYTEGTAFPVLSLTVPWTADLGTVQLSLRQQNTFTSGNATWYRSPDGTIGTMITDQLILTTSSIPEPAGLALVCSASLLFLTRGRAASPKSS